MIGTGFLLPSDRTFYVFTRNGTCDLDQQDLAKQRPSALYANNFSIVPIGRNIRAGWSLNGTNS